MQDFSCNIDELDSNQLLAVFIPGMFFYPGHGTNITPQVLLALICAGLCYAFLLYHT